MQPPMHDQQHTQPPVQEQQHTQPPMQQPDDQSGIQQQPDDQSGIQQPDEFKLRFEMMKTYNELPPLADEVVEWRRMRVPSLTPATAVSIESVASLDALQLGKVYKNVTLLIKGAEQEPERWEDVTGEFRWCDGPMFMRHSPSGLPTAFRMHTQSRVIYFALVPSRAGSPMFFHPQQLRECAPSGRS